MNEVSINSTSGNFGETTFLPDSFEWSFWLFMLLNLICFAIVKSAQNGYFQSLFRTAVINRQLLQNTQEDLKLTKYYSYLLTFTYFSSFSCILSHLITEDSYSEYAIPIFGVLVGIILLKWLVIWMISFVSKTSSGTTEHILNHAIFFQLGGLILTPILIITHFIAEPYQWAISLGLVVIIGLLILIREIQSLLRALKARIPALYIILYLCTLEMLPVGLVIAVIANNFKGLN